MNLTKFVKRMAWEGKAEFDFDKLDEVVQVLVRMLDNVLDLTPWPLEQQAAESRNKRRIGVGLTGLGNALIMMGLKYSSDGLPGARQHCDARQKTIGRRADRVEAAHVP